MLVHATTVALGGHGVLIRGRPGAGKSDLALRLIDAPGRGTGEAPLDALLVSDDQTLVRREGGTLFASPGGPLIAGKLEVRGQGIADVPHAASAPLALVVELADASAIERMPDPQYTDILGVRLPLVRIDAGQASAPARVRAALLSCLRSAPAPER
jgi:serine kinase of HPr protein (carbohydrate metabolism regulator)